MWNVEVLSLKETQRLKVGDCGPLACPCCKDVANYASQTSRVSISRRQPSFQRFVYAKQLRIASLFEYPQSSCESPKPALAYFCGMFHRKRQINPADILRIS